MASKFVRWKYPFEYEVIPEVVDKGISWLTLRLKNIGTQTLEALDIQLHSLDTYNLTGLFGAGHYLSELAPNKERKMVFRVNVYGSANVYATIKARKDGEYFWWESGWTNIRLSEEKAEIGRLLVLSNPYTAIGKTISAEATIKGLQKSTDLKLEFWVETPSGKSVKQAAIDIKDLPVGEEARYTAEFTPKESGIYHIYAYLYDGLKRIGNKTNYIFTLKK